jgi:protein phosphatase
MKMTIPELALVVMVGASGSGKSTLARKLFKSTEVLSSDFCRGLVSDDENNQAATNDAFEVLHYIASKRLAAGRLTVVDATNVQEEARKPLVALARKYHCLPVAIVLNVGEAVCHERNAGRGDRTFGPHVVRQQTQQLRRALRNLRHEGFRHVFVLETAEQVEAAEIERQPLWNNRKNEHGPFDIIGDVHGCFDELAELLGRLGYAADAEGVWSHAGGRKAVFVGDLVDRGPRVLDCLGLVMGMVKAGSALCVPGNHDMKLLKSLRGKNVQVTHGLEKTLAEIEAVPGEARGNLMRDVSDFLDGLVGHYVLDSGRLVVAHAGMKEEMQGRGSGAVREFALYGETTGETDEFGLPVRYNWAGEYRGKARVVYGHTPVPEAEWLNHTINVDTGCVFGGKLTALRYPEMEVVSVAARAVYAEPARPFLREAVKGEMLSAQQAHDDVLNIDDVVGKRIVATRLHHNVTIREENAIAALEVMSRFAANPKWLIYLPPTMSPCATSDGEGLLEHPAEAFAYFRQEGVAEVVCEQKHMGSRAVVIVCRDEEAARKRFGVVGEGMGICVTRTGRRFFEDRTLEGEMLQRVHGALTASGFWEEFATEWVCLDCELMPWSAKAQELIRGQYAAVGSAGVAATELVVQELQRAALRGAAAVEGKAGSLLTRFEKRREMVGDYVEAYRRYCWPVSSIADYKLAPFHVLATEGAVHVDRDHVWHMETLKRVVEKDARGLLLATPYRVVNVTDAGSVAEGVKWWEELTGAGGEGMVVKPMGFVTKGLRGLVQPAVKCRGREYLRIIYGRSIRCRSIWAFCGSVGWGRSGRWRCGSLRWGWSHWSGL